MLELINVSRRVGAEDHIVDVSLQLQRGSINVLLGPTLAGKTSLMRLMAGLDAPTAGKVIMDGTDVTGVPVRRRNIAMVYQQFINYPTLTVYENIASPMRVAGRPKAEIDAAVKKAADLLQMTPYLGRTPLNLSGGQQQRTALARALVKNADVVLLDEPLANLDYKLREELREELPKIFAATGAIFVYATTEPHEALLLGGRTATLSKGRVTQFGETTAVYRRPHDLLTATTFSDPPLNVFAAEKRGQRFSGAGGIDFAASPAHAQLADGRYRIGVRPHRLELGKTKAAGFDARVTLTEVTGSETFIHAAHAGTDIIALVHGVRRVDAGDTVHLSFDPAEILVFGEDGIAVAAPAAMAA
ncbi:ABC transporter ATP-binding protein [Aurantimonas sp. 22II-16-19i]|uniref:ABC transporter ATP-binding protein n=1 Tax=Aurantimonas sp. 22II-16-19i TaxID=1317114 RepID=UPI0009F7BAF9|nr:ABC transporter ATP-binding protein [Aurantimonas sp. 22II-16-19i]ORE93804.1 sugar ABC transporter ATP-binding protein [Aurantimonas sp. 22II-16-19i]